MKVLNDIRHPNDTDDSNLITIDGNQVIYYGRKLDGSIPLEDVGRSGTFFSIFDSINDKLFFDDSERFAKKVGDKEISILEAVLMQEALMSTTYFYADLGDDKYYSLNGKIIDMNCEQLEELIDELHSQIRSKESGRSWKK